MPCQGLHIMQCPDRGLERGKQGDRPRIEVPPMQIMEMQDVRLLKKSMLSESMAFLDMIILLSSPGRPSK